jgi:exodeoxyribonuclease-3
MRIATYNVNGINGRLGNLLGWLDETAPDIVCLQELKAPDEKFPAAALRATARSGTDKKAGTVWRSWRGAPSRRKPAAACRAILTIRTAAILKRRSAA